MGFHVIPKKRPGLANAAALAGVVRLTVRAEARSACGKALTVAIAADVARHLGWMSGDRVVLLWGDDDDDGNDRGTIRLMRVAAKDDDGNAVILRNGRNRRTLRLKTYRVPDWLGVGGLTTLPATALFSDDIDKGAEHAFAHEDGAVVMLLPRDWCAVITKAA